MVFQAADALVQAKPTSCPGSDPGAQVYISSLGTDVGLGGWLFLFSTLCTCAFLCKICLCCFFRPVRHTSFFRDRNINSEPGNLCLWGHASSFLFCSLPPTKQGPSRWIGAFRDWGTESNSSDSQIMKLFDSGLLKISS